MTEVLSVTPMKTSEVILTDLGSRMARGSKLTMMEQGMAMIATAAQTADRFGPGPADMKLPENTLPENVKGALAQFSA